MLRCDNRPWRYYMTTSYQKTLWDVSGEECPRSPALDRAVERLALTDLKSERGAVFTRSEIVDFILDLSGYTVDRPLAQCRILEPSFGGGDFLLPIIDRLFASRKRFSGNTIINLTNSLRAVELHRSTFVSTRQRVIDHLASFELAPKEATKLADSWLVQGDFLLEPLQGEFDFIVGNPPYIRQESIPDVLLSEYKRRYTTLYDRADLYIPFIERCLCLLKPKGVFGFICSDRWTKNKYGGPLRGLVAESYNLKIHVDMKETDAFHEEVSAYPAITVIARASQGKTRIARKPNIEKTELSRLAKKLKAKPLPSTGFHVQEVADICDGESPWLFEAADQVQLLRRLEADFLTLEDAGCRVGIGVATGADRVFIGNYDSLDIEPNRKLPLATTRDIVSGELHWQGLGVINPFEENGRLVDLARYPRLARYFQSNQVVLRNRHCAKKSPGNWYRTIDRIWPSLVSTPKLLIPDIKNEPHIVFDRGELYPHHNLYFVTSTHWDLRALQAILLSGIAKLFVSTYTTKIRGGYLRFQAQYLRRIHVPQWDSVPEKSRKRLRNAAESRDILACNREVFNLYCLSKEEQAVVASASMEVDHVA